MKKKLDVRRVAAFLLCLLLCGVSLPSAALAARLDEVESCSLKLSFTVEGGQPMTDVAFRLYRVAELTDAVTFRRIEPFKDYAVTASGWLDRAATLAGYVARDNVTPTVSGRTDAEGLVAYGELEKGLYLIVGDSKTLGDYVYTPAPFLLSLPYTTDGVNWESDVETHAKYSRRYIGGGGVIPGEPATVQYHVLKVWEDEGDAAEARPGSVTVDLLRDSAVYDTVTLSPDNNWRHDWTGLDADATWQVAEREVEDYTVSVSQSGITFVITNTYKKPPEDPPEEEDLEEWKVPLANLDPEDPEDPKDPEDPGEWEELPDDDPPLAELPQTGQLWWPVPLMAMGGLLLTCVGIVRRRRWSGEDEE